MRLLYQGLSSLTLLNDQAPCKTHDRQMTENDINYSPVTLFKDCKTCSLFVDYLYLVIRVMLWKINWRLNLRKYTESKPKPFIFIRYKTRIRLYMKASNSFRWGCCINPKLLGTLSTSFRASTDQTRGLYIKRKFCSSQQDATE